jgi:hypothetical protein
MLIISNVDILVQVRQEQLKDAMRAAAQAQLIKSAGLRSPGVRARLAQVFEIVRAKLSSISPHPQPLSQFGRGELR